MVNKYSLKKLMMTATLFAASAGFAEARDYNTLVVNLTDGSHVDVLITGDLQVSFNLYELVAVSDKVDVKIPRDKISHFTHVYDEEASVGDLDVVGEAPVQNGNVLSFKHLPEGSSVRVFNVAGVLMMDEKASGEYDLSLDGFAAGTYIVNVNTMSYKIHIR